MQIDLLQQVDDDLQNELIDKLRTYNHSYINETSQPLAAIARDSEGQLIGGVSGRSIYRQLLIEVVWVAKEHRGSGLGSRLMALCEQEAIKRGCLAAQLDTLSFQAPAFYAKQGFEVVGSVSGIPGSPDNADQLRQIA
ncbi:GNAT family N-acetyltransferase [Shewanella algae]|uniref:GNAT family N-acetyltransferase n=1 Tax=Shewanella algae TaxID=38313 RepID=UPI000E32D683|nr:GNAT family N-acetyltransferase [Shewanella algae]AXQ15520.1 GNAT family N-acetyltransferase [Shewanella algae]QXP18445.1 GNAT family N-acetyltransferase [Shewanella algae]QXP31739.1 GNAT family N-acetyltransferase [Shewanella algae]QXP35001.1 GNAT family N-acetyltransferase [Shewanella algae]QXP37187.1 GNAT family N-acetyltransferase [Shewanella algae]